MTANQPTPVYRAQAVFGGFVACGLWWQGSSFAAMVRI